jgi:Dolichyl-phosphate-mannose-protein mannosyltransferase
MEPRSDVNGACEATGAHRQAELRRQVVKVIDSAFGVLIVGALAACLALQGWKSRSVNFDVLTSITAAQDLIDAGRLPDKGVLTSFGSFTPPGGAWLMVPGLLIFGDPRLFDYVGSVALFVGTLFGIFLLARRYLGRRCAFLAVVVYAFSEPGLSAASSVWPRYPIHTFYVWTIYWATRWADDDEPNFLGLSILTWSVGLFVFMEMAPAILAIPVIWMLSRPSVRIAPVLTAIVLAAVVWSPYLRFEKNRKFADLRSQFARESLWPVDFNRSWCDPGVVPPAWLKDFETRGDVDDGGGRGSQNAESPGGILSSARPRVSQKVRLIGMLLLANFGSPTIVGIPAAALFLVALIGTVALFMNSMNRKPTGSRGLLWLGITAVVVGLVFNEHVLAAYLSPDGALQASTVRAVRWLQATLLAAGVLMVAYRRAIAAAVTHVNQVLSAPATKTWLLGVSLVVPWFAVLFLAETERRFLWLWPLQTIVLAAAVTYVPLRLGAPRVASIASLALVLIISANPVGISRLQSWVRDGWGGQEALEVEVVDRLASMLKDDHKDRASIGYEIDIGRFMAMANTMDPRYKVGADLDLLLKYRHGIVNLDHCAEGFSNGDVYRIVQIAEREGALEEFRDRIVVSRDSSFEMTHEIGLYQILRRH